MAVIGLCCDVLKCWTLITSRRMPGFLAVMRTASRSLNICKKAQPVCCAATGAARQGPFYWEHGGNLCLHTMMLIRSSDCNMLTPTGLCARTTVRVTPLQPCPRVVIAASREPAVTQLLGCPPAPPDNGPPRRDSACPRWCG